MKKLITVIISLILVAATLVACSKTNSNINETTTAESSTQEQAVEQTQESVEDSTEPNSANASTTVKNTFSKYVIVSFNAVQGAVIYKQDYDIHGYLESCQYHKKCEACGYVSNENGQARGNMHTSYYCTECGNNQYVEITADQQWVEIPYEN